MSITQFATGRKPLPPEDPVDEQPKVPFNIDAEQGFLGALMLWNGILEDVSSLAEHHFYEPLHQEIFAACAGSIRQGRLANPVTLRGQFENVAPANEDQTVVQYLAFLVTQACSAREAKEYARTIRDLALRRLLMVVAEDLGKDAQNLGSETGALALIEETEARLFAIAEASATAESTVRTFGEAIIEAVERAYEAYKGGWSGLRSGIADLDQKLGGLQETDLLILAGRPSMGKTALATNISVHVARTQCPVLYFSLEMSAEQLANRELGSKAEVAASRLRSGRVTEKDLQALTVAAKAMADLPLHIDQLGGASIAQVVARSRRMKRKKGVGLIVIDYLQLMQASARRGGSRVQDITEITTGLKALAKELKVPVLALSQLSRETERRENKRPQLSDLRESGSIEQDADVVMFCYREDYYVERDQPAPTDVVAHDAWKLKLANCTGRAEVIVGKHRHGEVGSIRVAFDAEFTRFSGLAVGAV